MNFSIFFFLQNATDCTFRYCSGLAGFLELLYIFVMVISRTPLEVSEQLERRLSTTRNLFKFKQLEQP
jgi:hypothetical protein